MHNKKIDLIITGGTISKVYNELTGELVCDASHIHDILELGRSKADINIKTLMLKDSLDINENDRELILSTCQHSASYIIITHGTDTMVKTAEKLSTITDKTIVLTGAMIPYAFKNSDAMFNLGVSIGAVGTLNSGVYICMNGKVFEWNSVVKNRKIGVFE